MATLGVASAGRGAGLDQLPHVPPGSATRRPAHRGAGPGRQRAALLRRGMDHPTSARSSSSLGTSGNWPSCSASRPGRPGRAVLQRGRARHAGPLRRSTSSRSNCAARRPGDRAEHVPADPYEPWATLERVPPLVRPYARRPAATRIPDDAVEFTSNPAGGAVPACPARLLARDGLGPGLDVPAHAVHRADRLDAVLAAVKTSWSATRSGGLRPTTHS